MAEELELQDNTQQQQQGSDFGGYEELVTLDPREHIRLRPGMYIGKLGDGSQSDDGIYVLMKEVIDNSIDEFNTGFAKPRIDITVDGGKVTIRDYGRGIPLNQVKDASSKMNTGAKYDTKNYKRSVGLNGVGIKAVNALSSSFFIRSVRDGLCSAVAYKEGLVENETGIVAANADDENCTLVEFVPDGTIFKNYEYRDDIIEVMIKNYSFLNTGLSIYYNGKRYHSRNGLSDLVNENMTNDPLYPLMHFTGDDIEVVITHAAQMGEEFYSFVNGQHTTQGGTHQSAFREAYARVVKDFIKKDYAPEVIRGGLVCALCVRIQEPVFEAQTKTKLGSTHLEPNKVDGTNDSPLLKTYVLDILKRNLDDYLHMHSETADALLAKINANEKERKEIAGIKKIAREGAKKASLNNRKLRDCHVHYNTNHARRLESTIFITEGDSASGSITKSRDVDTQAVFSLRGKPKNTYSISKADVYRNEELNLLHNALDIDDSIENLRYNNVVIATDADVDGMHIRLLLLTFFLRFYPELIQTGHVYILQTPLFRVRNKQKTTYCYTDDERIAAIHDTPKAEITRFKGLGEISPDEFKNFIGKDMHLDPVILHKDFDTKGVLSFYMGENTLERREFIMSNLRIEDDESIVVA